MSAVRLEDVFTRCDRIIGRRIAEALMLVQ
jgi:hypothetical protein